MPRLRHKVTLRAFRDCGVGDFNSVREFSDDVECWANIEAVSAQRYIGNLNTFGAENAVSHTAEMRKIDLEVFTELRHGDDVYRILNTTSGPDGRFMNVGLAIQCRDGSDTNKQTVFVNG